MTSMHRRTLLSALAAAGALAQERAVPAPPIVSPDPRDVALPGQTRHTRFAVNVERWFPQRTLLDRIRAVADLGFSAIELWALEGRELDLLANLCGDLKIEVAQFTIWGVRPALNDPSNHRAFLDAVHSASASAKQLGARKVSVLGGDDRDGLSTQELHQNIALALQLAAPIAENENLMLLLQPLNVRVDHSGHCLSGSTDAVRICRQVNSPMVKVNWNLYHMQISEGDLCGHLKQGFDQLGYLQLADHPGRHEPGTGEVHFNRVLRAAKELGYDDLVGLDCNPEDGEAKAAQRVYRSDLW
jgi:hydroxypyruvate isomerase